MRDHSTFTRDHSTASHSGVIPNGAKVQLPDGSEALCYRDCGIGRPWNGRYITRQRNPVTGGERIDTDWRRDQLVLTQAR